MLYKLFADFGSWIKSNRFPKHSVDHSNTFKVMLTKSQDKPDAKADFHYN